jgi:hypothetical protein
MIIFSKKRRSARSVFTVAFVTVHLGNSPLEIMDGMKKF